MGNKLDQQNDLESAEICPKTVPENIQIQRFSNLQGPTFNSSAANLRQSPSSNRWSDGVSTKRKLFYFGRKKKRKNKPNKNGNLGSARSLHIENDANDQCSNEPVQTGNGLVSLKNLNYYLESETEFHLVNRILKRIGVFNRQTQTDFGPFSRECLKLIEVSQHLVDELECLNYERPTVEELDEEHQQTHNEGFNMVYCGKVQRSGEASTRNVNVQRCISRATVGTNTVQSIAHLTICAVLAKLGEFDEQVRLISKLNQVNQANRSREIAKTGKLNGLTIGVNRDVIRDGESINQIDNQVSTEKHRELDATFDDPTNALKVASDTFEESLKVNSKLSSKATSKATSKVNSFETNLDDYFWDSFEGRIASGQLSGQLSGSNQFKRQSDTFISNSSSCQLLSDRRSPISKYISQPVLSEPRPAMNDEESNQVFDQADESSLTDQCKEDALESMDKQKLEEYLKNLLLQVQLSQEHQKKGKKSIEPLNFFDLNFEH